MIFDEFYQTVDYELFYKWIVMNTKQYLLDHVITKIVCDDSESKVMSFELKHIYGEITIWTSGIVEEKLIDKNTNQPLFYLHYSIIDLSQCCFLFKEFYKTLLNNAHQLLYKVAFISNSGLSTSVLVDQLKNLYEFNNLHIDSLSIEELTDHYQNYDALYLAPQIAYMQSELLKKGYHCFIYRIDATDFATKNYQNIYNTILKNKEAVTNR